ncbi:hypothetical protein FOA52_004638 [Chlamydomonas sp. UWO 241]|nr:hypothetical protein FOA52_004638 [Chlamydomonas sp. UWO 241]
MLPDRRRALGSSGGHLRPEVHTVLVDEQAGGGEREAPPGRGASARGECTPVAGRAAGSNSDAHALRDEGGGIDESGADAVGAVWVCVHQEVSAPDCPADVYVLPGMVFVERHSDGDPWCEDEEVLALVRTLPLAATVLGCMFTHATHRHGPWSCYQVRVAEGNFGQYDADVMFPNRLELLGDTAGLAGGSGRTRQQHQHQ